MLYRHTCWPRKTFRNHATALDPKAVWVDLFNPTNKNANGLKKFMGTSRYFQKKWVRLKPVLAIIKDEAGLHAHIYFLKQEDDGRYRNSSIVLPLQEGTLLSFALR